MPKQPVSGRNALACAAGMTLALAVGSPQSAHASFFDGLQEALTQLLVLVDPILLPGQQQNVRMGDRDSDFAKLGLTRGSIQLWEDGLRMDPTQPGYGFEWWYFDGTFDDGSSYVASFYSRIDLDPTKPFVKLTITTPQGEILAREAWGDRANSAFSKEECNLHIGAQHAVTSDDGTTYHVKSTIDDVAVDLVLQRSVASFRQDTGHIFIGNEDEQYLAWFSKVPKGHLSGTITYGGQTRTVSGTGYHDHNWGTAKIQEAVKSWWWMRGYVNDMAVIAYDFAFKNKYGAKHIPIYGIVSANEVVTAGKTSQTKISGADWDFPEDPHYSSNPLDKIPFEVNVDTGSALDCLLQTHCIHNRFTSDEMMESIDLLALQSIAPDQREFLKLLSYDPWYLRYNGSMSLDLQGVNGRRVSGTGTAIIEYLDLQ
jgi:hypothetical protein